MRGTAHFLVLIGFLSNDFRSTSAFHHPSQRRTTITMAEDGTDVKQDHVDSMRDMRLKEEDAGDADVDMDTIPVAVAVKQERSVSTSRAPTGHTTPSSINRQSRSPVKPVEPSPAPDGEQEDTVGGGVTVRLEPGKPPKLARTTSHRIQKRPPQVFSDYEDKTSEAKSTFAVLQDCTYAAKYLGTTETALECDCAEEWGKSPPLYSGRRRCIS